MPVYSPAQPAIPNVTNFSPQNLKNWRKALAKVRSGAGNSRVLFIGDSTTIGINASGVTNWPNITDNLAALLSGSGTPATSNSFAGFSVPGATSGSRLGTDTRMSAGSWTASNTLFTLGGAILQVSSGTSPFQFTPTVNVDTANVIITPYGTGGSVTFQLGSGTTVTGNYSDAGPFETKTVTNTLGSNTLKATYVSGGTCYIEAVEVYNSAVKSVNIMNAGWWGSKSSQWNDNSSFYSPIPTLKYLAPDLTVIVPGINDWGNLVSTSTFSANVQALITAAQIAGDVILATPTPNNNNTSVQPNYISAIYQLAAANNCVLIDNYARWVSYGVSNPLGLYADTLHPTTQGYADQAQMLKYVMLNV